MNKKFLDIALQLMKKNNLKLTKPRLMVIEFLADEQKAMTPYEIRDNLAINKRKADVVTLYRVLDELEKIGLVHKVITLGRYVRCNDQGLEDVDHQDLDSCHHYLICERCHKVEEISGEDLSTIEKKIAKNNGFQIKSHTLEFLGLCKTCQL
ncbi:transcriptional repressor [Candidatus Peregrinibacteria bacterium]|nr:transcriptional repressor [Candidatus Peregrinibacteria bacterium]